MKQALGQADGSKLLAELSARGKVSLAVGSDQVELDNEDIQVRLQAKPGWAAAQGAGCVVVLATELTPELINEGIARDFVRVVQDRRKDMGLDFTDRIEIAVTGLSAEMEPAIQNHRDFICGETLATGLRFQPLPGTDSIAIEIGDEKFTLFVRKKS